MSHYVHKMKKCRQDKGEQMSLSVLDFTEFNLIFSCAMQINRVLERERDPGHCPQCELYMGRAFGRK